jgi:hypothetical protein
MGGLFHDGRGDVVELGACCDFVSEDEHREQLSAMGLAGPGFQEYIQEFERSASFRVSEFAVLADGRRLTLHDERGFSVSDSSGDLWRGLTLQAVEADVRRTVLPDEADTEDEHAWEWLAGFVRAHGVEVSADRLRSVPCEVEFSERLLPRLSPAH